MRSFCMDLINHCFICSVAYLRDESSSFKIDSLLAIWGSCHSCYFVYEDPWALCFLTSKSKLCHSITDLTITLRYLLEPFFIFIYGLFLIEFSWFAILSLSCILYLSSSWSLIYSYNRLISSSYYLLILSTSNYFSRSIYYYTAEFLSVKGMCWLARALASDGLYDRC